MTQKNKKRIAIVFLLMSYCAGVLFAPIYAEDVNDDYDPFDALLSEREGSASINETEKKKTDISDFTDVSEKDWFYKYLDYLVENEVINGKTETTFEPGNTFSYAECSAVIVRYLGLEAEADKRMKKISERSPEMKSFWYAGYFEVLSNFGLFNDYELFEVKDGKIQSVNKDAANSPIVRYRFAECISKSFELDGKLKAENVYSEIGGRGREFIVGGMYDKEILRQYEDLITDYADIPEKSREYVLKSYYNGIFNGDVSGNFYPNNNLTRGEMAKVLATVIDYSLRTRLVNEGYASEPTKEMLHTDPFGVSTLGYDSWVEILESEAEGITVSDGAVKYTRGNNAPFGYAIDVYLYTMEKDGVYGVSAQSTLHEGNEEGFTYRTKDARILLVLRNTAKNARPEGVLEVVIENGAVVSIRPNIYQMPVPEENATPTDVGVASL